ncbi:MAG: 2-oxo-4-hydroxy-4-carboxy-5-ureidoimidazoline decarboxylase [Elusimicrobiota bacterium]|nr:2-oxo-4-hydroxy-4-carboxy-5-ureidoimidazoline decarboxylase [Elusimicrobiota bacterium]
MGATRLTLAEFNALPPERAAEELLRCCGCARWARAVAAQRPFASRDALVAAADREWSRTSRDEWRETMAHHPRIGGKDALRAKFAATKGWSQGEQASVAAADEATLDALAAGNAEYEKRHGFIFIVCATGRSADEMLALLTARLPNTTEQELAIAAGEQAKITRIRLEKLIP